MSLLTRYILAHFRRIFLLALASFVGLYMLVEFFDKIDNFVEHKAELSLYLLYFANLLPVIASQIIPLAVLLGGFLTLGGLSRTHELTAMRSGGMSLWRISTPILLISAVIALIVLAANESVVPIAQERVNHIYQVQIKGKPGAVFKRNKIWFRDDDSIINVRYFSPEESTLRGVTVFSFTPDFQLKSRTDAPRADYSDNTWKANGAYSRDFDPTTGDIIGIGAPRAEQSLLNRSLEDLKIAQPKTDAMSYRQLRSFVAKLQTEGYDPTRYRVDMHARLAQPFTSVIMAILAIPFALQRGRRSNLAMGVGFTLLIGISYYILHATVMAFGYSGVLPPVVAAWAANVLFCLLGLWMLLVVRY